MKTRTCKWLSVPLAATALVSCSSGDRPEDLAPEDTVAPIDDNSFSRTTEEPAATEGTTAPTNPDPSLSIEGAEVPAELTEAERAVFEKYDIDPDDARKAFEELLGVGMSNAATGEEFSEEQGEAILDKYGIDAEDFYRAYGEMVAAGADETSTDGNGAANRSETNTVIPQPLDGGEYTWPNGVRLALRVVKVEPWGGTDDYCGDGSCGVSNPDDLRWVLRYDVTVPESFPGPFDAYSCPGELHIVNGNDDDAMILVAGADFRSLDGTILPGATRYGQAEYSIERDALGGEFYIESSCGDTEFAGEVAYFRGTIDA
jgi:hypothetical protein